MGSIYSIAIPMDPAHTRLCWTQKRATVEANTYDYNDMIFERNSTSYEFAYICPCKIGTPLQFLLFQHTNQTMNNNKQSQRQTLMISTQREETTPSKQKILGHLVAAKVSYQIDCRFGVSKIQ